METRLANSPKQSDFFPSLAGFPKLPGFGWDGNPTRMVFLVYSRSFTSSPASGWGVAEQAEKTKFEALLDPTGVWMLSLHSLAGGSVPTESSLSQQPLLEPSIQALTYSHTFIIFPSLRCLRSLQPNWVVLKRPSGLTGGFRLKGSDFPSLLPSVKVPLQYKDTSCSGIYRGALHPWIEPAEFPSVIKNPVPHRHPQPLRSAQGQQEELGSAAELL